MRILIIRGFPDVIQLNGYNSQELGLARALREKGHVCDIVYFCGKKADHVQEMEDGIRIFWRHGWNVLKNGVMPGLRELAADYDVVQVNEYDQLESWVFYTFFYMFRDSRRISGRREWYHSDKHADRSRKIPVVIYNGNYYSPFNHGYNLKCAVFDRTLLKITGKKRREIYCLTKSVLGKTFLEEKGFDGKHVRAVGVGLDIAPLERNPQHDLADRIPEDGFELLYIGKFEERRNIPFLLSVIEKVCCGGAWGESPGDAGGFSDGSGKGEKITRFHATLIGTGNDSYMTGIREPLQKLIDAGVVTYYEKAPQNELAALYKKAKLLLLPTSYEIFGMVLLEAMFYGCVPLTTLNGGASVLIRDGENGFIAEMDVGKWAEIILRMAGEAEIPGQSEMTADRPERQRTASLKKAWSLKKMSMEAMQTVREGYTWDRLADTFLEVYRQAASAE